MRKKERSKSIIGILRCLAIRESSYPYTLYVIKQKQEKKKENKKIHLYTYK